MSLEQDLTQHLDDATGLLEVVASLATETPLADEANAVLARIVGMRGIAADAARSMGARPNASIFVMTRSGQRFYLSDPRPEDVNLEDIAWSLGHQNRFAGHAGEYRIDDHSLRVAALAIVVYRELFPGQDVPELLYAYALLHDAHEYVTGDVLNPLGRMLHGLPRVKARVQEAVHIAFGLDAIPPSDIADAVHQADVQMLGIEARNLFPNAQYGDFWSGWEPNVPPGRLDDWQITPPDADGNPIRGTASQAFAAGLRAIMHRCTAS